jgi:hypothetical protein
MRPQVGASRAFKIQSARMRADAAQHPRLHRRPGLPRIAEDARQHGLGEDDAEDAETGHATDRPGLPAEEHRRPQRRARAVDRGDVPVHVVREDGSAGDRDETATSEGSGAAKATRCVMCMGRKRRQSPSEPTPVRIHVNISSRYCGPLKTTGVRPSAVGQNARARPCRRRRGPAETRASAARPRRGRPREAAAS